MANIKLTAVQGLTEEDQVDYSWEDFYGDEEEQRQKEAETLKAKTKIENEPHYEDDFEDLDPKEVEEELEQNEPEDVSRQEVKRGSSLRNDSTDKLDKTDSHSSSKKSTKKSKPKKPKTHTNNKPPPLNLYQDLVKERLLHSKERTLSHNQDTMSDQEVGRRRGRRLHRRVQMKKYHSMEHAVEQAGRDRLEQKFMELEELMTRPLVDTRGTHVSKQQMQRMMKLQHQHAEMGYRGNNSQHTVGAWVEGAVQEEEEGQEDNHAYSTIRMLQATGPNLHMQITYNNQHGSPRSEDSHHSATNTKLTSKPPVPWRPRVSADSSPTSSSGASQRRNSGHNARKENGLSHYFSEEEGREEEEDDNVTPRRVYISTEMHLKYSDNPKLQEWLKHKDTEYRRARKAQRAKKREERNEKMVERELKIARREKSAERVKQWMEIKRKEALRRQKEERRRKKQEAQELAARRAKSPDGVLRGSRIDRPQSAPPANTNKKHIPIKRPESAVQLDNGDGSSPKPPDSKFVYKRPVSGRVRLMKLQNARNAQARSADQKRYEELSAEEKEKKARTSYDAWLIAKRKQDIEKRKEAKRQKELIKSDPEMERIIPELAARRIERIKNGKKSIDTGISQIDKDANKRFGGGNFGEEAEQTAEQSEGEGSIPKPSSYKLAVNGSAASLVEVNTRARPISAKTRMPIPQSAFSPRRPQSAKATRASSPKVKAVMDTDQSAQPNPFKLPFPDDQGVPEHVKRVQERIFSKQLTSQSGGSERPEPQGCAAVESATCLKGVDGPKVESCPKGVDNTTKSDTPPRASMVLLQEIEAEAVQSEEAEHAALLAVQNVLPKEVAEGDAEQTPTTGADEDGQAEHTAQPEEAAEKPAQDAGAEDSSATEDKGDESVQEEDNAQGQEEQENEEEGEEEEEAQHDEEEGGEQGGQENEEEKEGVEGLGENEEPSEEGDPHQQDAAEPDSVDAAQQAADNTYEYEEEPEEQEQEAEKQQAEEPTDSQPDAVDGDQNSLEDTGAGEDGVEGSDAEDSSRKLSEKHVSFSEDLTVFEPGSTETSSNFEDERGDEGKEDGSYMSLDDAPDCN